MLEPAGAASIKFRDRDIVLTAHRVDHELISLDLKLIAAKGDEVATAVIAIQVSSTLTSIYMKCLICFIRFLLPINLPFH